MPKTPQVLPKSTAVNLMLLLLGVLILLSLYLFHHSASESYELRQLDRAEQSVKAISLTQRELVNARLQEIDRSLLTFRRLLQSNNQAEVDLRTYMLSKQLETPELLDFFLLDKHGQMQVWTFEQSSLSVADRDYFRIHQQQQIDQVYLSAPTMSRLEPSALFIALSRPVFSPQGEFEGVIVAAIDVYQLAEGLGRITQQPGLTTALLTLEGGLIYRMPLIDLQPGLMVAPVMQWQGNPPDNYSYRGAAPIDGKWRQTAYQRLNDWSLLVVVTEDLDPTLVDIARFQRSETYKFIATALLVLLSLLFCGWMVQRQRRLDQYVVEQDRLHHLRLEEVQQLAHLGYWEADLQTGSLWWSDIIFEIFGQNPQIFEPSVESFSAAVHPEDRDAVMASTKAAEKLGVHDIQHRIIRPDGSVRWVHERARVELDDAGQPARLIGSVHDITAQKQHEEAIRRQADALQTSNEELEQFAYIASHDLRQPLRMITSFSQIIDKKLGVDCSDEIREYLGYVTEGGQRLDDMLQSLLEYSRVGRGGEPAHWCALRTLLDEALVYLGPEVRKHDASISVEGDWPSIWMSRNEGVRLFQNLIANAIKFHAQGQPPVIAIKGRCLERVWEATICDQGIGIEPEQVGCIFKVFRRLNPRSSFVGEGIGLSVCRKIVQRHGGEIHASSEGLGKGTCIRFSLPWTPAEESHIA
ncbi:ATP-binding protein [Nitrincola iocasae]|uniref:histidine kinase n=1 Tax=Nitrincola iocasae TaxID=2614693 RepID=A0A5J6LID0_9GAMM|nr:ATP-binding protein [Nitrincola iocasae]QEW08056.1 PAS domain-containing protein [Nitrincola iocasae]